LETNRQLYYERKKFFPVARGKFKYTMLDIFAHRYPTDATNTVFKRGFGSGTFTYANGVAEETNDSNYPSVIGVKYILKIVFNGKDEFTQTITGRKTGNYTVETYKRL
jgi:hypothetical protein